MTNVLKWLFSGIGLTIIVSLGVVIYGSFFIPRASNILWIQASGPSGAVSNCSPERISLLRQSLISRTQRLATSHPSLKIRNSGYQLNMQDSSDSEIVIKYTDEQKIIANIINNIFYKENVNITVHLYLSDYSCLPQSVYLSHLDKEEDINLSNNYIDDAAERIVDIVEPYLNISALARNPETLRKARNAAFKHIHQSRDTVWYKNIVAFTYLKEAQHYDHKKNRRPIKELYHSASFWLDEALREDKNFVPAIVNKFLLESKSKPDSFEKYEYIIKKLLNIHYKYGCGECLTQAASFRMLRHSKNTLGLIAFKLGVDDLSLALEHLQTKKKIFGQSRQDTSILKNAYFYLRLANNDIRSQEIYKYYSVVDEDVR